jgi:hypothetical protein
MEYSVGSYALGNKLVLLLVRRCDGVCILDSTEPTNHIVIDLEALAHRAYAPLSPHR